jgi:3-hydroxyacyl-CoA dehydrogenase
VRREDILFATVGMNVAFRQLGHERRQAVMNIGQIVKVTVVDTGVLGTSIALALARAGFRVAAGLETTLHALQYIFAKTGDAAFKPPAILERKVA